MRVFFFCNIKNKKVVMGDTLQCVEEGLHIQAIHIASYDGQNCPIIMSTKPSSRGASNKMIHVS